MKYLVAVLGVITMALIVGVLFLLASTIGSVAIATWAADTTVRYFTYIGIGIGGLLGLWQALKYLGEQP